MIAAAAAASATLAAGALLRPLACAGGWPRRALQLLASSPPATTTSSSSSRQVSSTCAPAAASAEEAAANTSGDAGVEVTRHGHTALVELNRPKAMNALSTSVMHAVVDAVDALDGDPAVRAIVLTGRGRAFAAGADIREMASLDQQQAEQQQLFARWQQLATGRRHWTPLIAAVNGVALGGGTELALLCDVIVASSAASFGLPEVTLGVIPGIGGTQRLTRLVGRAVALDAMLTARRLSADEALAAGLVSRVVPPESLLPEALAIANRIASMPAGAVARVLQATHAADSLPLEQGLQYERELFYGCFGTHDQAEGMAAFLEKRPAVFNTTQR